MDAKVIGLIGAGHIGSQLARLAVAHGYEVVISNSRGPETLLDRLRVEAPRLLGDFLRLNNLPDRRIPLKLRSSSISFDEPSPLTKFSRQLLLIRRSALVRESLSRFQGSRCFGPCRHPPQIRRGAYRVWPQSFVARRSPGPPNVAETPMPRLHRSQRRRGLGLPETCQEKRTSSSSGTHPTLPHTPRLALPKNACAARFPSERSR